MEDWWENWFSDLDMNGDNSSLKLNECEMNSCCNYKARATEGRKKVRSCWEIEDHVMAERKRRHEMAERFVALSSIIPGLKKIDKASVLDEAINYVKQLKGRIAILEQQSNNKSKRTKCTKSIISFTQSQYHPPNNNNYNNHHHNLDSNQVLPQIEAICIESEKEVLFIRIQCEKCKSILFKLLVILQNMHLSISSSSVLPFGKNTLNIAIIAKMGEEYKITGEELVKKLRQDLMELYEMQNHVIHASASKEL